MPEEPKKTFVKLCQCEYWVFEEEDGTLPMAVIDFITGEVSCVECSAPLEPFSSES